MLPFVLEIEAPVLSWPGLPTYIRDYCGRFNSILEVWVSWLDEAATWKLFTEIPVVRGGVHLLFRAVRAQGDALVRVLCQAFSEFYIGQPITLDPSGTKSMHGLYLTARFALRTAMRRQLQLIGREEALERPPPEELGALASDKPHALVAAEKLWDRKNQPRFGPAASASSNPGRSIHAIPRGIVDRSLERAFMTQRYSALADRIDVLLAPFGDTTIAAALSFFVRMVAEEARNGTLQSVLLQPYTSNIRSVYPMLKQLFQELVAVGQPPAVVEKDATGLIIW